ncbi:SCO family protein [Halorientalis brevis]|uniref:SCO family protein n=1 Tax=Halorientalis brevis TaxID=1126241 RepID=A0ABD6CGR8_9EURY|nr:SCO family protein [Halorientalis brevis]
MHRRTYLTAAATAGVIGTAGCLGSVLGDGGNGQTILEEPEGRQFSSSDLPYPAYGQQLPEVTLRAPLAERDVTTTEFDDRNVVMTFFYSNCNTVCPILISSLKRVQDFASENGFADDVAFLAVTFDPQRDDAERLRQYADTMNVDRDAGNWYFLRPDGRDRAKDVVQGTYGVTFERTQQSSAEEYMFNHLGLVVLANEQGVVERAYTGDGPKSKQLQADLETLRAEQS